LNNGILRKVKKVKEKIKVGSQFSGVGVLVGILEPIVKILNNR
jgi:hypothetical protein